MVRSNSSLGGAQTPAAAVTLAQSEFLAPVVLAVADVLIAAIDRIARLLARR